MGSLLRFGFFAGLLVLLAFGYTLLKSSPKELTPSSSPHTDAESAVKNSGDKVGNAHLQTSGHLAARALHRPSAPKINQDQINQALFKPKPSADGFEKANFHKSKLLAELKTGECFAMAYLFPKRLQGQNMNAVPVACKFAQMHL